jgi:hypothetical protein
MLRRLLGLVRRSQESPDAIPSQHEAHRAVLASGGEATHTVVLRLDPTAMENADLQVRWDLEKTLRALYPDIAFYDDGYGFARNSEAMFLVYATRQSHRLVEAIVDLITNNKVAGYEMAAAAMVAVAPREPLTAPGQEFVNHRVVYPPNDAGRPIPD